MSERSNFTMLPNIAFDLLTNEFDLVGYQKLLRVVGMGGVWKGGNVALAKKLNMSRGRIPKLKSALVKVGFIKIIPGDSAHGEADEWHILDIWERNRAASTLSRNGQAAGDTLSQNDQGQTSINTDISLDQPCHETVNPLSRNNQPTLSRNDQDKEKIFFEEGSQDLKEQVFVTIVTHTSSAEAGEGECALPVGVQPSKIPKPENPPQNPETNKPRRARKPDSGFEKLAALCFLKKTSADWKTLSEKERGQLNQNLKKMRQAGFDLTQIGKFEEWWCSNWRSGTDREHYEPPRPDQVVTFWHVAMNFEEVVAEVRAGKGKPVWVTVGKSEIDVSDNYDENGNYVPKPLDEPGRKHALEILLDMQQFSGDKRYGASENAVAEMKKWYLPEDWKWLMNQLEEMTEPAKA